MMNRSHNKLLSDGARHSVVQQSLSRTLLRLAAALAVLAWLLPNHVQPWGSFYNESAMGFGLLLAALGLLLTGPRRIAVPRSACLMLALATMPWWQRALGQVRFDSDALLASLYLAGLAVAMTAGARWQQIRPADAATPIFAILAIGAVASAVLALIQWQNLDWLGVLIADLPLRARPTGNLAQANHLATLQFWGLIGLWGLFLKNALRGATATVLAVLLIVGLAMTQSRTGWLEIALLCIVAFVHQRTLNVRRSGPVLLSLLALYGLLVLTWPAINQLLQFDGGLTIAGQMWAGRRPMLWRMMIDATLVSPWAGFGWTQVALAHQAMAPQYPDLGILFTYAHNVWLDLCLWNGVPIGLTLTMLMLWWWLDRWRNAATAEQVLLLLALTGLLVHSQVEMPHAYAYFCLPAGFIAGMVGRTGGPSLPRPLAAGGIVMAALALSVLTWDYGIAEQGWREARATMKNIAGSEIRAVPRLLDQLAVLITQSGQEPQPGMTAQEQFGLRRMVERFPGPAGLYRLARMHASHGRPEAAERELQLLCALNSAEVCQDARRAWAASIDLRGDVVREVLPAGMASTTSR